MFAQDFSRFNCVCNVFVRNFVVFSSLVLLTFVLSRSTSAQTAQAYNTVDFGPVPIGTTSVPQAATFKFLAGGTIGAPQILTMGAPNLDYADAGGGSCAAGTYSTGDTCTVNVTLTPLYAGARKGAVVLADTDGNVIATAYIQGIGTGPQVVFSNTTTKLLADGLGGMGNTHGLAVDGAGNIFATILDTIDSLNDTNGITDTGTVVEIPASCSADRVYTGAVVGVGTITCMKQLGGGYQGGAWGRPLGIAVDGAGNVFVAGSLNGSPYGLGLHEIPVNCINGANTAACVVPIGGYGENIPVHVAVDGSGNVYFTGAAPSGRLGVFEVPIDCINGTNDLSCVKTLGGGFTIPYGIAVDGYGNVYVADHTSTVDTGMVKEIPADCINGANDSTCVKLLGTVYGNDIAVDASGSVYFSGSNGVEEIPVSCINANNTGCVNIVFNTPLATPAGLALDSSGNIYFTGGYNNSSGVSLAQSIKEIARATSAELTFPDTLIGSTSQSNSVPSYVGLENIGTSDWTISVPGSGTNPFVPEYFAWDSSSTCPQATAGETASTLAPGATCDVAIDFAPTTTGLLSDNAILTGNAPNGAQFISLSGMGILPTPVITPDVDGWTVANGTPWSQQLTATDEAYPSATYTWSLYDSQLPPVLMLEVQAARVVVRHRSPAPVVLPL